MGCNYNDYTKKLTLVHSYDQEFSKKDLRVTVFDYGVMSDFDCEKYYKNQLNYKQECPAWAQQNSQISAEKQEGYQIMEAFDRRAYTDRYGKGGTLNKTNDGLIEAYKEIIPAIMKQTEDSSYFLKKEVPEPQNA